MLFTYLINEISAGNSLKILCANDATDIADVSLIDGTQTEYKKEILYFGHYEQLIKGKLPHYAVLVKTPQTDELKYSLQRQEKEEGAGLAFVAEKDLFLTFNRAAKLLNTSRSQGIYGELMDCAARSKEIAPVINLAAAKLGNSLLLLDADYKILSYSTIFPIDDPLWKENIRLGYCSYEFVSEVQKLEAVKNAARNSDPVVVTCYASPLRKLSSKIFIHGQFAGIVLMLEKETPISPMHLQQLPIISEAAGDALARYAPYLISENTFYQKLLYDLLIGASAEEIAPRIANLNLTPNLCALCIQQSRYLGQKHLKKEVAEQLTRYFPDSRFTFHENGIAVLLPLGNAVGLSREMQQRLENLARTEHLRIGVSNLFFRIENFAKRYAQAMCALELAARLHTDAAVSLYADYAFYDLLSHTEKPDQSGLYCHPALSILSRYDHAAKTDLYHTLEAFLDCNCSIKDTAQKLFIHRNSLNYRLERIESLTQVDLNSANERFLLEMSYRIDHFMGRNL